MKEIHAKTFEYLKIKLPNFKVSGVHRTKFFTCPFCKASCPSCKFNTSTDIIAHCNQCGNSGNIYDFVKILEPEFVKSSNDEINQHIAKMFNMTIVTETDVNTILDFYKKLEFDLVPIQRNGKIPVELRWPEKNHKDIAEWQSWLQRRLNIGVKTGQVSNIIGLDIDSKNIPSALKGLLISCDTLLQESGKGYHYFFKYDSEIINGNFDYEGIHIDVKSDGGQIVIFPSIVEGVQRKILNSKEISVIPAELKEFLKENLGVKKPAFQFNNVSELDTNFSISGVSEGSRNNFLTSFGGILRKNLSLSETQLVLELINQKCIKPPLEKRELSTIVNSLNKYISFDHSTLAKRVLDYLRIVQEASARDIKEVVNESKELVDKTLAYLAKEEKIIKMPRGYKILEKVDWKQAFLKTGEEVSFKFPYFHDTVMFRDGDMVVIGASAGAGKSHIAMNIIKRLVDQGVKPYYISLESGNRFSLISTELGLKEGDFYWDVHYNPENIELEKNAVTIIDWLLPKDYASTDKIFEYFSQQLKKNGGLLVIFVQLRNKGEFFASDMLEFFPAYVCKFVHDSPEDRSTGKFIPIKVREAQRGKNAHIPIPTKYVWETKELKRVDELEENR